MSQMIITVKPLVWTGYEGTDGGYRVLETSNDTKNSSVQYHYRILVAIDDGVESVFNVSYYTHMEVHDLVPNNGQTGLTVERAQEIVFEHHKKEVMKLLVLSGVGNDEPEDGSPNLRPVNANTFDADGYSSGTWAN